ncbi:MAG TPA: class II aldolase/adducin family protein [Acidimicrobiales bacterium]|nr:class II aldolase/adducin family protein [Acidimicrobiales bacterium]
MTRPSDVREAVLATAREMYAKGLVEGTSGNVSGRMPDGSVCVTPSSIPYASMGLEDLVILDPDGHVLDGSRSPTSEKDLHLACYRAFAEVGGVIHSHATYASMFACARQPVPAAIEEFVVYVGGDVPVCDYTLTGTPALGEEAVRHLAGTSAALLASHGMITIGATPAKALHVALVVERTAQIVHGARALGGEVRLPDKTNRDFRGVYELMRDSG